MNHFECSELKKMISDYLDGELSENLCHDLERHMNECHDCQIVINTFKKTIELSKTLQEDETLPGDVRQRLFKCLDLHDYLGE